MSGMRVLSEDYAVNLAKGQILGHEVVEKFGENPDLPNTEVFETIWDGSTVGTYVPPTVARVHAIVGVGGTEDAGTELSADDATGGSTTTLVDTDADFATDTVAAGDLVLNDTKMTIGTVTAVTDKENLVIADGMRDASTGLIVGPNEAGDAYRVVTDASTGASVFHVVGTGADKLPTEEFVILNGTTPVNTALANGDGKYLRQYRAHAFSGANTGNVRVIKSTAASDGTISCQILAGINQTLMAVYPVPANKTGLITSWWGAMANSVASAVSIVRLRVGVLDNVGFVKQTRSIASGGASSFEYVFPSPLVVAGGRDIWMEANSDGVSVAVSGGFNVILFDA